MADEVLLARLDHYLFCLLLRAEKTAVYPDAGKRNANELMYLALGLSGEAGELANHIKKVYRDQMTIQQKEDSIKSELGDVMWYVLMLCRVAGLDLRDVIESTLNKLEDRQSRNVLHGDGDNR